MALSVQLYGQHFQLHPSGACYWEEQDAVLLADVHLGKSSHFRKHGMAVPVQADDQEFDKLNTVIEFFKPSRLWFLGDLFHSYQNAEWHFFEQWVRAQTIDIALIMGNHDVISRDLFERLQVKTYDALHMGQIILTHHPEELKDQINIAGHVHPSVRLRGVGRQYVKLPCFFCSEYGMILPAFGDFTGTYALAPKKGNRIFAIADQEVIELS